MQCPAWDPGTRTLVGKLVKSIEVRSSVNSIVPMSMLGEVRGNVYEDSVPFPTIL